MHRRLDLSVFLFFGISYAAAYAQTPPAEQADSGAPVEVRLITLDPGHFHAALVQKTMYEQISPDVHVFAPPGADVQDHLARIRGFNTRAANPTSWREHVHMGDDFLPRMLADRPGNVVVLSGNNRRKAEYIQACVAAGLNVLSDKPMCIDRDGLARIEEAFKLATKNDVLLYDIMTERSEITTILQKALVHTRAVFGELVQGTPEKPAVVKESVHHFFKQVAGKPIKRPVWYFDTSQQGEGIVDVTTHLVDLVQWECFPGQPLEFDRDVRMLNARRWPTKLTRAQFEQVTRAAEFPDSLQSQLDADGTLPVFANGEMVYALRGIHTRVAVQWNFEAPEGGGDTHYSIMRGTLANVIIRQGKEQDYRPELYVDPTARADRAKLAEALQQAMDALQEKYPGVGARIAGDVWQIAIPDKYRVGHEAHFREVTERYLKYLEAGELPAWEVPNMLNKYRTTTAALEMAQR